MANPYRLLFVCMGNICRSPAADGIMRRMVTEAGLGDVILIDSAGTGGWHAGDLPDNRMRRHAKKRGYELDHIARQVSASDFDKFDMIVIMDQQNGRDIKPFTSGANDLKKLRMFCDFAEERDETEVPDPYYDGAEGFEQVLDILEDGCKHLLAHIRAELHV